MFTKRAIYIGGLLIWFLPSITLGQVRNGDGSIDCTEPTMVEVNKSSIEMVSTGDYEAAVTKKNPVVFYRESDKYSFWYKIVISHTCDLKFDILPSDAADSYNFFLYKYEGDNFCKGIIDNSVTPFRSNLFERVGLERGSGIGNTVKGQRMESVDADEYFYFKPMNQIIDAQKGHVYYLNVHHLVGEDCGHSIEFTSCEKSLLIEAKHKPCYEPVIEPEPILELVDKLKSITSVASISTVPITDTEMEEYDVKEDEVAPEPSEERERGATLQSMVLKPEIFDARSARGILADIDIVDASTGRKIEYYLNDKGEVEVELKQDADYSIVFSSLGYENTQIDLTAEIGGTELRPVYLKPKAVGSSIVLNNIYFHPNTYVFRNGADEELVKLLSYLKTNEGARIEIQGHTNGDYRVSPRAEYSHLSEAWNYRGSSKKLSKLRAGEVRDYLTKNGIVSARLTIVGLGGEQMIIPDPDDYEDRLVNMRVEILILDI